MTGSNCAGTNALRMGALSRRNKGSPGRQDQAGQGGEVDGAGRWHGDLRWEQSLGAASPAEVTPLERALDTIAVGRPGKPGRPRKRPQRLLADRGYDSTPLRARLARRGTEPISPARANHTRATHQDGRTLRRYRRRRIVERTFAWLGHFRRLVVRYERLIPVYAGSFHLACALLTLRKVLK
jgi:transposase